MSLLRRGMRHPLHRGVKTVAGCEATCCENSGEVSVFRSESSCDHNVSLGNSRRVASLSMESAPTDIH